MSRDVPLITNVDVLTTDGVNGEMQICWSKPKADDLDTLLNLDLIVMKCYGQ
ncbi:MAG: hypothetical protein IPJ74_14990 [Saprospiraceae bacterium]|nr:hypothetical protein [Saprospiraceae bacterium]